MIGPAAAAVAVVVMIPFDFMFRKIKKDRANLEDIDIYYCIHKMPEPIIYIAFGWESDPLIIIIRLGSENLTPLDPRKSETEDCLRHKRLRIDCGR